MDKLREDVRASYDRQQAALGDVGASRRRLMAAALENRDDPAGGRLPFVAGVAAVALAAIIVATLIYVRAGGGTHLAVAPASSPSPTKPYIPPTTHMPAPVAGFVTVGADPLSASSGWLLVTNCVQPMTVKCHYSVVSTADGGRTWSKAVQVGPLFDPAGGGAPRKVRFINSKDGFVSGGGALFATHDGGRSWSGVAGLPQEAVVSVTGTGSRVWLLTYPCSKGILCPYRVRTSTNAGRNWSSPFSLPLNFGPMDELTIGDNGLIISSEPAGDLEITLDGGASWQLLNSPCVGNVYRAVPATADGNELWQVCLEYPNTDIANERLFVSENAGKSWALHASTQVNGQQIQDDYSTILVSPRAGTALRASIRSATIISHDGGKTWSQVGPHGVLFVSMRFAGATDGWALDIFMNVWVTTDGGDHWTQLA